MACNCSEYPLPKMLVDATLAKNRRDLYKDPAHQGPVLKASIGLDPDKPCIFYSATDFSALYKYISDAGSMGTAVDAVRIYFAVYNANGQPNVPKNYGGKFTFLFAPVKLTDPVKVIGKDIGQFYTIPPGGPFNPGTCKIDTVIAQQWIGNWVNGPLKNLPAANSSQNQNNDGSFTDTKCVLYADANLSEMVREMDCQLAGGINIYLVSYLDADKNFPRRLTTQLTFADSTGADMTTIDISCRKPFKSEDLDTGNPCPPAVGCTS